MKECHPEKNYDVLAKEKSTAEQKRSRAQRFVMTSHKKRKKEREYLTKRELSSERRS